MANFRQRPLFTVRDQTFCWEDAFIAASHWGTFDALKGQLFEGLALERQAKEKAEGDVGDQELEAWEMEFRYMYELVKAKDLLKWLAERDLTVEEWREYGRRAILRTRKKTVVLEGKIEPQEVPTGESGLAEASPDVTAASSSDSLLLIEGWCSGQFDQALQKLAKYAAVDAQVRDTAKDPPNSKSDQGRSERIEEIADEIVHLGCSALDRTVLSERVARVLKVEESVSQFRSALVTPKRIREQIASRGLDWVRVESRTLTFADQDAAREAALCIREDGGDAAEVAARATAEFREHDSFYIADIEPGLQGLFTAAQTGDLLGPFPLEGRFILIQVKRKILPDPDDPDVQERVEAEIMRRAFEIAVAERVRWLDPVRVNP